MADYDDSGSEYDEYGSDSDVDHGGPLPQRRGRAQVIRRRIQPRDRSPIRQQRPEIRVREEKRLVFEEQRPRQPTVLSRRRVTSAKPRRRCSKCGEIGHDRRKCGRSNYSARPYQSVHRPHAAQQYLDEEAQEADEEGPQDEGTQFSDPEIDGNELEEGEVGEDEGENVL